DMPGQITLDLVIDIARQVPGHIVRANCEHLLLCKPHGRTGSDARTSQIACAVVPIFAVPRAHHDNASRFDRRALLACTILQMVGSDERPGRHFVPTELRGYVEEVSRMHEDRQRCRITLSESQWTLDLFNRITAIEAQVFGLVAQGIDMSARMLHHRHDSRRTRTSDRPRLLLQRVTVTSIPKVVVTRLVGV